MEIKKMGAGVFIGLGMGAVFGVISYLLYQISRMIKNSADLDERYQCFEGCMLDKIAGKHDINLSLEIEKRKYKMPKSVQTEIKAKILDDLREVKGTDE